MYTIYCHKGYLYTNNQLQTIINKKADSKEETATCEYDRNYNILSKLIERVKPFVPDEELNIPYRDIQIQLCSWTLLFLRLS